MELMPNVQNKAKTTEDLILSLCIARRISPMQLANLAVRLSHLEAVLDAQTDKGNQRAYISSN
ncbi:hypothetical protein [Rahnella sp. PCH160]|uniref:hypothetical protein n=1 Tax=Rahnella sp. PCH160 TaxID=3447928 RepID=UPI0039FBF534